MCGMGFHHFFQVSRLSLYGHTGVLGSHRSPFVRPTVQARGPSLCCPSTSAICTLGQNLARCLRTTLEVGWWLHGFRQPVIAMLPRVLCVYGGFRSWWYSRQPGGLHGLLNLAISPERMALTYGRHRSPPGMPNPGIDPTTFRLQDLCLAQLS